MKTLKMNIMYRYIKNFTILFLGIAIVSSCSKDILPRNQETADTVFNDPNAYIQALAKIYAGIALSGQQGPAGSPDISGIDEGFSNYLRQYWKAQELSTDLAKIAWNDGNIKDYHTHNWSPSNEFIRATYDCIIYQVALANEFIRQTSDEKLASRGVTGTLLEEIQEYRAEARFMRALSYWHALDLFGNVPFVTDLDGIGAFLPKQISREDLFVYIEEELLEIESQMIAPRQNDFGRADAAAAWTLLAKLYLNAEVYVNEGHYTEALTYINKVIDAGYQVNQNAPYSYLFLADNDTNPSASELIFSINFDGKNTQNYGGMTFLVHASIGGSMIPSDFGVNSGWFGIRTTSAFVNKFPDINGTDSRGAFYTDGQNKEIADQSLFTDGYAMVKFKNVDVNGNAGSDPTGDFPDTDFPMFRLADVYLMYAEAVLRGGQGGSVTQATDYINILRSRAYGNSNGNISTAQLTLDFILDERARELYWEGHRRTDLSALENSLAEPIYGLGKVVFNKVQQLNHTKIYTQYHQLI